MYDTYLILNLVKAHFSLFRCLFYAEMFLVDPLLIHNIKSILLIYLIQDDPLQVFLSILTHQDVHLHLLTTPPFCGHTIFSA